MSRPPHLLELPPPPAQAPRRGVAVERYDGGLRAAHAWLAAHFPHLSPNDREPLVRGLAAILWPHIAVAATFDMSDSLADEFPDIAAVLDRTAHERLAELKRGTL